MNSPITHCAFCGVPITHNAVAAEYGLCVACTEDARAELQAIRPPRQFDPGCPVDPIAPIPFFGVKTPKL